MACGESGGDERVITITMMKSAMKMTEPPPVQVASVTMTAKMWFYLILWMSLGYAMVFSILTLLEFEMSLHQPEMECTIWSVITIIDNDNNFS